MLENTEQYDWIVLIKELAPSFLRSVLEYYRYDPEADELPMRERKEAGQLRSVHFIQRRWRSAVLGIEFDTRSTLLVIHDPHGEPFCSSLERAERERAALRQAVQLEARAADVQLRPPFAQQPITLERTRMAYLQQQAEKKRIRVEQAEAALQAERDCRAALEAQRQTLGVDAAQLAAMWLDQPAALDAPLPLELSAA